MDLYTRLHHLKNGRVQVNGNHYHINSHGVAHNVSDEDAAELMQHAGGAWQQHVAATRTPVAPTAGTVSPNAELVPPGGDDGDAEQAADKRKLRGKK